MSGGVVFALRVGVGDGIGVRVSDRIRSRVGVSDGIRVGVSDWIRDRIRIGVSVRDRIRIGVTGSDGIGVRVNVSDGLGSASHRRQGPRRRSNAPRYYATAEAMAIDLQGPAPRRGILASGAAERTSISPRACVDRPAMGTCRWWRWRTSGFAARVRFVDEKTARSCPASQHAACVASPRPVSLGQHRASAA